MQRRAHSISASIEYNVLRPFHLELPTCSQKILDFLKTGPFVPVEAHHKFDKPSVKFRNLSFLEKAVVGSTFRKSSSRPPRRLPMDHSCYHSKAVLVRGTSELQHSQSFRNAQHSRHSRAQNQNRIILTLICLAPFSLINFLVSHLCEQLKVSGGDLMLAAAIM